MCLYQSSRNPLIVADYHLGFNLFQGFENYTNDDDQRRTHEGKAGNAEYTGKYNQDHGNDQKAGRTDEYDVIQYSGQIIGSGLAGRIPGTKPPCFFMRYSPLQSD